MIVITTTLFVTLLPLISGIVVQEGTCPDIKPVQNFDVNKFSGKWYITHSDPLDHDIHLKCTTETFTPNADGNIDGVFAFVHIKSEKTGNFTYRLKPKSEKNVGDFVIEQTVDDKSLEYPIKLIATDYDNYLVFWCCKVKDNQSYRVIIIESRQPNISEDVLKKAYEVLDKNNLDRTKTQKIIHDCSH